MIIPADYFSENMSAIDILHTSNPKDDDDYDFEDDDDDDELEDDDEDDEWDDDEGFEDDIF